MPHDIRDADGVPTSVPAGNNQWKPDVPRDPGTDTYAAPAIWAAFADLRQGDKHIEARLSGEPRQNGREFKGFVAELRGACDGCHAAYQKGIDAALPSPHSTAHSTLAKSRLEESQGPCAPDAAPRRRVSRWRRSRRRRKAAPTPTSQRELRDGSRTGRSPSGLQQLSDNSGDRRTRTLSVRVTSTGYGNAAGAAIAGSTCLRNAASLTAYPS